MLCSRRILRCHYPIAMLSTNQSLNQGRYRIVKSTGQSSSGVLYEAFDTVLQSNVILKEIVIKLGKVSTVSQQEAIKLAFSDEAKDLKQISNESFQKVLDYFSEIDRHYLVMESNDESNLKDLLEKKGRAFSYSDAINWAEQILNALSHIHLQAKPFIHRDIKPQNITLSSSGKIKLSLPEISRKLIEKFNKPDDNQSYNATSLHFLPLEQIWEGLDSASQKVILNSYNEKSEETLKQPTDVTSDIYSLGATLYYLLTAQLPIDALERSIDILEGKSDPLLPPAKLNPSVPVEISDILMKALEIKRENRFNMTAMMRQVLRTSVLKIKEREDAELLAEEAREEAEALKELQLAEEKKLDFDDQMIEQKALEIEAEQKRLEEQRQLIEKKKLEIEAARKRQKDSVVEKETKAAAKQIPVEKPVVEAKNSNLKDEVFKLNEQKSTPQPSQETETASMSFYNATNDVKATENSSAEQTSMEQSSEIFADTPKSQGGLWKIPVIAVALIALSGVVFGIWYSKQSAVETKTTAETTTQATSANESPKTVSASETAPVPTGEQTTETKTSPASNLPQTSANPVTAKTKPVVTPTPAKPKKLATPPQTAENQKKPVTVDDLINDN
jgi:serine/threonine protein kinase